MIEIKNKIKIRIKIKIKKNEFRGRTAFVPYRVVTWRLIFEINDGMIRVAGCGMAGQQRPESGGKPPQSKARSRTISVTVRNGLAGSSFWIRPHRFRDDRRTEKRNRVAGQAAAAPQDCTR
jgi:hypothetical protein